MSSLYVECNFTDYKLKVLGETAIRVLFSKWSSERKKQPDSTKIQLDIAKPV
ncbi:MAG: hypothetical protein QM487_15480 [Candidatus Marithrix sp.]